jgi:predicted transcriptional regulator
MGLEEYKYIDLMATEELSSLWKFSMHLVQNQNSNNDLELCQYADLVAHELGWIWVLYYSIAPNQTATNFALVHADGNPLLHSVSDAIISSSRSLGIAFSKLSYISPPSIVDENKQTAQDAYYKYLENELGEIQFEGMPTDKDAGAVKVNLENIFVPLRFKYANAQTESENVTDICGILEENQRAAILAKPGGGKSTLIRRIALAYAYPERRLKVDDGLPDNKWFPIYIRCRDLGDDATKSIMKIIGSVATRAEITKYSQEFVALTENALQEGNALLLIDGLDEISNENYRVRFANQLRTFVATYPNTHLIITSRVAGFRAVAGTLASYCEQYSIADFNKDQISSLSIKWHQAVLGDAGSPEESKKVCDIIFAERRIMVLAENPLLLTTLLFVKRWVGYLPTKKCQLYAEMIKLLLVTWNAVAHDKLDIEETEPQLAYVAYSMTIKGKQTITKDELEHYINEARSLLPEILGYTSVSASTFITQVEDRSSLLIQVGLEENERGNLVESYEFSHLSFQEYLTARSIAEGWVSGSANTTPLNVLKSHMNEDHWKEVIPLTAVLIGRNAREVVEYLLKLSEEIIQNVHDIVQYHGHNKLAPLHLANCIASEVPMTLELLEKSVNAVIKCRDLIDDQLITERRGFGYFEILEIILKSKYGKIFQDTVKNAISQRLYQNYLAEFLHTWSDIQKVQNEDIYNLTNILSLLERDGCEDKIAGTLQMMLLSYKDCYPNLNSEWSTSLKCKDCAIIEKIFRIILELLKTNDELLILSVAWCIGWSGYAKLDIVPESLVPLFAHRLIELWVTTSFPRELKRMLSWGVYSICAPYLKKTDFQDIEGIELTIKEKLKSTDNKFDSPAAICIAVLMEYLSEKEAIELIASDNNDLRSELRFSSKYLKSKGIDIDEILYRGRKKNS